MRIRTIKPEFWQDEKLAALSAETRLLAIGLLNYADDDGYFVNHPALIRAAIFPFAEESGNIPGMLIFLAEIGFLELGKSADGKNCGKIINFRKHQKISKPQKSKVKGFETVSRNIPGTLPEHSRNTPGGNGTGIREQGTGNRGGETREARNTSPPVVEKSSTPEKPDTEESNNVHAAKPSKWKCSMTGEELARKTFAMLQEVHGWQPDPSELRFWGWQIDRALKVTGILKDAAEYLWFVGEYPKHADNPHFPQITRAYDIVDKLPSWKNYFKRAAAEGRA